MADATIRSGDAKQNRDRQLREQGYADGRAGRRERWDDPIYRAAHRRGRDAREADAKGAA